MFGLHDTVFALLKCWLRSEQNCSTPSFLLFGQNRVQNHGSTHMRSHVSWVFLFLLLPFLWSFFSANPLLRDTEPPSAGAWSVVHVLGCLGRFWHTPPVVDGVPSGFLMDGYALHSFQEVWWWSHTLLTFFCFTQIYFLIFLFFSDGLTPSICWCSHRSHSKGERCHSFLPTDCHW